MLPLINVTCFCVDEDISSWQFIRYNFLNMCVYLWSSLVALTGKCLTL